MSKKSVNVSKSRHSELIGRGGSIVKSIQESSGAKLTIPRRDDDSTSIVLTGTDDQIQAAIEKISEILGYTVSDEPLVQRKMAIPPKRFGALIGRGGSTLNQLQKETGVTIDVPRRDADSQLVSFEGNAEALKKCKEAIAKLLGESYNYEGEDNAAGDDADDSSDDEDDEADEIANPHAVRDDRPASAAVKAFVWGAKSDAKQTRVQHFYVPKRCHGKLVGRGGSVVQQLEKDSSTKIKIPRRDDEDISICVTGTIEAIEKAQDLMEAILGFEPQPAPATKSMLHENKAAAPAAVDMNNMKRFYIPHSCFFELVGHNGHTVKGIEKRENVKIRVPHKGDEDMSVRVYGSDAAIAEAAEEMEEVLGFAPSTTPIKAVLIKVPAGAHAKIIGEHGTTLKRLEEESDCNIRMPHRQQKDQRILLEGNDAAIAAAIAGMKAVCGAEPDKADDKDARAVLNADIHDNDEEEAPQPTPIELKSLKKASARLWALDRARLGLGTDVFVNVQRAMAVYHTGDRSREHFFDRIERDVFVSPTFRALYALLDNYEAETGRAEVITVEEKRENWTFIHACCNTPVMRYAHAWCVGRGLAPADEAAWKKMLYNAWFAPYSRGARNDSSGFEHVFVGEVKNGAVTGFHNWMQFYREEKATRVDYRGYVVNHRRGRPTGSARGDEHVLSIKFAWGNEEKPVSTFVLGCTPEYELALYSMCFFNRVEKNKVLIDGTDVTVTAYRIRSRYGDKIGTAFPTARS